MRKILTILGTVFIGYIIFISCSQNSTNNENKINNQIKEDVNNKNRNFKLQQLDIDSNGNRRLANLKVVDMTIDSIINNAENVSIVELTKSPYNYLGKIIKVHGLVRVIEQMPPDSIILGTWHTILIACENPNSIGRITTLCVDYKGKTVNVNPDDYADVAGYFVGTYETTNLMGGVGTAYLMVGNYIK